MNKKYLQNRNILILFYVGEKNAFFPWIHKKWRLMEERPIKRNEVESECR